MMRIVRQNSLVLLSIILFSTGLLTPGFFSSRVKAETAGWYQQDTGTTGRLFCVSAVDGETVWSGGYLPQGSTSMQGLILRSTDGGNTWNQSVLEPAFERIGFTCIKGTDADTAWAGGGFWAGIYPGGILAGTLDGGATLNFQADIWRGWFYCVSAVDQQTAWAAGTMYGGSPLIMKTTDGTTWSYSYGANVYDRSVTGISAVDADTVWAVGTRGMILKTEDGANWVSQDFPTTAELKGVSAVNETTAWAVGSGGLIIHTTDGATWSQQYAGVTVNLTGVAAVNADTAWAAGSGGTILKTIDGGSTWAPQASGVTSDLCGVSAVDGNTAWAADGSTLLLRTTDGGAGEPAPCISSAAPASGPKGTEVTIKGSGFMEAQGYSLVSFGPVNATEYVSWSDTELVCRVPSMSPGAVQLTVTTTNGTSNTLDFEVTPSVTVSSITPTYGVENMAVDINGLAGTGFKAGATVKIEKPGTTVSATEVNVVSGTRITCRLDLTGAPIGKYDVVVKNSDDEETTLTQGFSVTNICGGGAAISLSVFGIMMGLMSLAGSAGLRRRFRKRE